jgi:hypothetical protein
MSAEMKSLKFSSNVEPFKDIIEELANEMVYNHLANSFDDFDDLNVECQYIINTTKFANPEERKSFDTDYYGPNPESPADAFGFRRNCKIEKSCRNILVIGTGASHDSYPSVPLGKELTEELEREFRKNIHEDSLVMAKYEADKANVTRLLKGEFDFENCLSLLSNYIQADDLRSLIQRLTAFRYEPSLFYEIVAHLFKHNFIDVIINFNFDELLDHALEEEVGRNNYHHILHDGDCISINTLTKGGRLKVPVYIKPHGTFSHSSTMRFTKQHYLDIPPEIKNLLESLIGGERAGGERRQPIKRVNLICMGFDLTSLEFNEILDQKLPAESRIYHFVHKRYEPEKLKRLKEVYLANFFSRAEKGGNKNNYQVVEVNGFESHILMSSFAELFSVMWRVIHNRFRDMYRPRSIGRHEILNYLFYRKSESKSADPYFRIAEKPGERDKNIRLYLIDRILVEIALMLIRSNGIVDVVHLLSGRIGMYFSLYCQQANLCNDDTIWTIYQLFGEFTKDQDLRRNEYQPEFIYSRNVFRILPFKDEEFQRWMNALFKNKKYQGAPDEFKTMIKKELEEIHQREPIIASILLRLFSSDKLSGEFIDRLCRNYQEPVRNGLIWQEKKGEEPKEKPLLNEIFRMFVKSAPNNYFTIRSPHQNQIDNMWESFHRDNLLTTSLAYKYRFRHHFLADNAWDILLCVSESGSLIDFLPNLVNNRSNHPEYEHLFQQLSNGGKRLVMICSFETVRQQHCKQGQDLSTLALIEQHKKHLADQCHWNIDMIDLLLLPYWQHNHHSIIFLKGIPDGKPLTSQSSFIFTIAGKQKFLLDQSYYYYKKGFSHTIYPIFFPITTDKKKLEKIGSDQLKLLSLFYTYVCRSIVFLDEVNPKDNWFNQLSPCFNKGMKLADYRNYTLWSPKEFDDYMSKFISFLYSRLYPGKSNGKGKTPKK